MQERDFNPEGRQSRCLTDGHLRRTAIGWIKRVKRVDHPHGARIVGLNPADSRQWNLHS